MAPDFAPRQATFARHLAALLGYPSESDLAVLRVTRRRSECRLTHLLKVAAPDGGPAAHVSAGSR